MKSSYLYAGLLAPVLAGAALALLHQAPHPDVHPHPHDHAAAPWVAPGRYPDRIALTWSGDPASTLSVAWRTDTTVTAAVAQIALATPAPRFDREAETWPAQTERLDARAVEGEDVIANYHSITFEGLLPDTLYAYRVGDGADAWSEWFHARTASAEPEPLSFIYFGDAQNGIRSHWSRAIRAAYAEAPSARFVLHAGDLVNQAHRNAEWGEWFTAGGFIHSVLPSVPVPGNHEYRSYREGEERQLSLHWRPQFTLPTNGPAGLTETAYYLDVQGVRIVALNSNTAHDEQVEWLDRVLAENPHPWAIVAHHHPLFSSSDGRDNPALRELWKPLYDRHGVDLVLQGHDHTYARGRDLNVPEGATARDLSAGTVYVNSVSGAKMYEIKEDRWERYDVAMERAAENTQLFQVVSVEPDTLRFRAYTVTGQLYDAFDLVKEPEGPNRFVAHAAAGRPERIHETTIPYRMPGE